MAANSRVYVGVHSDDGSNARIVALDAATGTLAWQTTTYFAPQSDLALSARRVYATDGAFLSVLDRATGQLIARVRAPGEGGMVSPPVAINGAVFIRVGRSIRRGVYQDAVWSIIEP